MATKIITGNCLDVLPTLPEASVQCCVTSPPYFGLRDYGMPDQIGLEPTPDEFVAAMVAVFREVRRVLRDDGTLWLNLGDSYAGSGAKAGGDMKHNGSAGCRAGWSSSGHKRHNPPNGLKPKDLIGIPWRVAFALQADGWYLRQEIIWHKPNPMPESVTDRCTKAHESVFLLTKSPHYFFDAKAISEPAIHSGRVVKATGDKSKNANAGFGYDTKAGFTKHDTEVNDSRNRRSVWTINSKPYGGAHFATMPPELAETCIKAGSAPGDMVLDPFGGAGTTGLAADRLQRDATLIELSPEYARIARDRLSEDAGMFGEVS